MTQSEIIALSDRLLVPVYRRAPVAFTRGEGAILWDAEGKRYLDFFSSLAVCNLGHGHPAVTEAIRTQAEKLLHVSNIHHCEPQAKLARALCENCCAQRVFFCNSGAEANEAAIKLARLWGGAHGGRYEILTALGSFHGRTLATLTATGQEKVRRGFEPLPEGFRYIPYNDARAAARAIGAKTAAVMVEPIQGEGGVVVPSEGYLRELRNVCDDAGVLLILDEIQTGMGRTGKLFAHQWGGIEPDIFTVAKALGNGVPIGAMLSKEEVGRYFTPGSHGSTFGGNALATAAALATLEVILQPATLAHALAAGQHLMERLKAMVARPGVRDKVKETRGLGLMIGMELAEEGGQVVSECLERGLIINCTANRVLRFLPPLTISLDEIDEGLGILEEVLSQ